MTDHANNVSSAINANEIAPAAISQPHTTQRKMISGKNVRPIGTRGSSTRPRMSVLAFIFVLSKSII